MASRGEDGERNEDVRTKGTCRTFEATLKTQLVGGWRDGSMIKSTCFSCRGPVYNSQHSEWVRSICDSVPRDLTPSQTSAGTRLAHGTHTSIQAAHSYT